MITRRKPARDDTRIYRLIKRELIPISHYHPESFLRKDLWKRLKGGKTYVSRTTKGTCIGFIHLVSRDSILWVDMLAVGSKHQGNGIGQKLMKVAERIAKRKSSESIHLYVDSGNEGGIRFYERNGFKITQYIPNVDCYLMEKSL